MDHRDFHCPYIYILIYIYIFWETPDIVWVHSQLCDIIGDHSPQLGHISIHGDVAHLTDSDHLKEPA